VLWNRVRHLPGDQRAVVEALAVAGAPVDREVITRAVSAVPGTLFDMLVQLHIDRLARTVSTGSEHTVCIYHDRLRESLVANLAAEERAHWHRRLAQAMEDGARSAPETVAYHWEGAGERERAAGYVERAAAEAEKLLAFDAIAESPHVVEQKIAVRMERHEVEGGDGVRPCLELGYVASLTADVLERGRARLRLAGWPGERRRRKQSHEIRERFYVITVILEGGGTGHLVTDDERAIAARTIVQRKERRGNAHLVQVRIARKLRERGNLSFPTEFAHTCSTVRDFRHGAYATAHTVRVSRLCTFECAECIVRNVVHEAQPK
jgi:hypothetical protein